MTTYLTAGQQDMWLVKIDLEGNVQWEKRYGGKELDGFSSAVKAVDGGYLLFGQTRSFSEGERKDPDFPSAFLKALGWVVKVDREGNVQWNKTYSEVTGFHAAAQTYDRGYVIIGPTYIIGKEATKYSIPRRHGAS